MIRKVAQSVMYGVMIVGLVMALAACGGAEPTATPAPSGDEALSRDQILVLGEVSSDPVTKFEQISLLLDYLTTQLADSGIKKVDFVVTTDLETMMDDLATGKVDLFFDNPYVALLAYDQAGAQPMLRRWRKGVAEYHPSFIARRDSGVTDLQTLLGHSVALDRPESATGDMQPRAYLLAEGYTLAEMVSADSRVAADEIGYVYAGSDDNILAWVLEGKTTAGVLTNDVVDGLEDDVKSQLVVVGETPDVPRHIVMSRAGLDPALAARIVEVLTNMNQVPDGQAALKEFGKTDQFDQLPLGPEGTMRALEELFAPVR
jgi:phosphonate transport system substrate-binding protein